MSQRAVPPPPAPQVVETEWDPGLAETISDLLFRAADLGGPGLESELAGLERRFGARVHAEAIYLLSHLRLSPEEARRCWAEILEHRDCLSERLDGFVDLRVALVNYFLHINRKLRSPKIIELRLFERTWASAYRDELTGLYNYRFFRECLHQETARAARSGAPLSLVLIDVDDFKPYNDRHGHEAGNAVLSALARLLAGSLRRGDVAARYGGEEFVLVLPHTPKAAAEGVAERGRRQVEEHPFPHAEHQPLGRITVSLGIATFPGDAVDIDELVRCADRALYLAKSAGKNQVQRYGRCSRSYRRVAACLDGVVRAVAGEPCPLRALNLSEGGLRFRTSSALPPAGALVEVVLQLPGAAGGITAAGRLVHVSPRGQGAYEAGVRFVDLTSQDRCRLAAYLAGQAERPEAGPRDGDPAGS
jgi:diguanylate cyclase (GGDEF)-like protein